MVDGERMLCHAVVVVDRTYDVLLTTHTQIHTHTEMIMIVDRNT